MKNINIWEYDRSGKEWKQNSGNVREEYRKGKGKEREKH